jgi:GNAT superfamily N-acetyltransferase
VKKPPCVNIVIRPAQPWDIPRMSELLAELFNIESDFTPNGEKQAQGLSALIADLSGRTLVLVAVNDAVVIGMATVQTLISTAEGGRVGLIEDVIVDKKHCRMGIGTLLLQEIVDWSRKARLKRLQLLADFDNRPALDFYSSQRWISTRLACMRLLIYEERRKNS